MNAMEAWRMGASMMADYAFWTAIAFMVLCSLYGGPRIKGDPMVMQWGFDGRSTWSAPKAVGLWVMVVIALFTRSLIWAAMTYFPQTVHNAESGLLMSSIIFAVSHVIVLVAAVRANPTT